MSAPRRATFGELLYDNIDQDEYLQELYESILFNYSLHLFNIQNVSASEFDIDHALRFADLLSKSVSYDYAEKHKIWAQEIVAMLNVLYPNDPRILYYMGSVLANGSNYRGLKMTASSYKSAIIFDEIYERFEREYLRIPTKQDEYFFHAQKEIFDNLSRPYFSYSGPTSMGKSLIMRVFIKQQVLNDTGFNFALLVPTKALINEVKSNIIQDLGDSLKDKNYRVISSARDTLLEQDHHFVFVVTPERFLHLITSRPDLKIDYLFVDEAHKISSKGGRSAFYYKVVDKLSERDDRPHVIFASPNIPNPEIYLKLIPEAEQQNLKGLMSKYAPVSQLKYVVDFVDREILMYNDRKAGDGEKTKSISRIPASMRLSDVVTTVGVGKQNVIYCSSKDRAVEFAQEYARSLPQLNIPELNSLSSDIQNQVHNEYYLAKLIKKGVAYHVGYLPASIRLRIEKCFKDKLIHTVFCTSTLVEGVNLPADNLFITSYKNGNANMTQVEFRNLIGRVGRIEYNLYGNVFLVRLSSDLAQEKFIKLLEGEVPEQKLSIATELTKRQKRAVIDYLLDSDIKLGDSWKTESREDYSLMRKFSLMFLRDISNGKNSLVRQEFEGLMQPGELERIKSNFVGKPPSDNINMSFDQYENLEMAIKNGLEFPTVDEEKGIDPDELLRFLERLSRIFMWDHYESHTLGKRNRDGEHAKLRWYAVVLSQWIGGYGLARIISSSLRYKEKYPQTGVWSGDRNISETYEGTTEHKNYVIADILGVIENVILFSISNYFREVSLAYKEFHGVDEFDNDWYDFVEYGTTNPLMRILQRAGYSRETAEYIKSHKNTYVTGSDKDPKLKYEALNRSSDIGVVTETEDVKYNYPELFADLASENN